MPRIKDFDSLPVHGAAPAHGGAITASFPFSQLVLPRLGVTRLIFRLIAKWKAAREVERTINALSALSDYQLHDIGLSRANIVSAATQSAAPHLRDDPKE